MTSQHFSLVVKVMKNIVVLPQLNLAYVHQYMPNECIRGLIRDVRQGPL